MSGDHCAPVLAGQGDTDYARYMRTDVLLSLQLRPDQMVHRDELLFQTAHQASELWLKLTEFEAAEAARLVRLGHTAQAELLLARASAAIELIRGHLRILRHLAPGDFHRIRLMLGAGSGLESPGWRGVHRVGRQLCAAFADLAVERGVSLLEVYRGSPAGPLYRLAEALVDWDDQVALWRAEHYKTAIRILGSDAVGTKGRPVGQLAEHLDRTCFPQLRHVRTQLAQGAHHSPGATSAASPSHRR